MEPVAIVVPIYKPLLNYYEDISLLQLVKVLHEYPIIFVYPRGMDISLYKVVLSDNNLEFRSRSFNKYFFESTESYNKLLLSLDFFLAFKSFKYILIYQLDAFVFKNNLKYWIDQDYDYIGAPWFNIKWGNLKYINSKLPFWARHTFLMKIFTHKDGLVGNGGLSLRKTSSHIDIIKKYKDIIPNLNFNEDVFWSKFIASKEKQFRIPLLKEAVYFSFETFPHKCIKITNGELPFGCHAWFNEKNRTFWKPFLTNLGYTISE